MNPHGGFLHPILLLITTGRQNQENAKYISDIRISADNVFKEGNLYLLWFWQNFVLQFHLFLFSFCKISTIEMEFALIVSSDFTPKAHRALVNGKIPESCIFFWVTPILEPWVKPILELHLFWIRAVLFGGHKRSTKRHFFWVTKSEIRIF